MPKRFRSRFFVLTLMWLTSELCQLRERIVYFQWWYTFLSYFVHSLTPPYITFSTLQVSLVLSALQAGNKGTQACITAATAVSGIIADLDTTIMFATAGTLNAENGETFADHRYWGRLYPAYLNRVVTFGHPAQDSEMWVSTLISTRFSVGNVIHRIRTSSISIKG